MNQYLRDLQKAKFTGYVKVNFSQGSLSRIEKFEEVLKDYYGYFAGLGCKDQARGSPNLEQGAHGSGFFLFTPTRQCFTETTS